MAADDHPWGDAVIQLVKDPQAAFVMAGIIAALLMVVFGRRD